MEPNGGVVIADATTGNATESILDNNGNHWTLSTTLDPDGHNVDVAYTNSSGISAMQKVDGNAVAPSMMAAATTQSILIRTASASRHTMGKWAIPGAAVAVAGCAIAVVGAALVFTAAAPVVIGVVVLVGASVALVGATMTLADMLADAKKHHVRN